MTDYNASIFARGLHDYSKLLREQNLPQSPSDRCTVSLAEKRPAANRKNVENAGFFPTFCDCRFPRLPMLDFHAVITMHEHDSETSRSQGQENLRTKSPFRCL